MATEDVDHSWIRAAHIADLITKIRSAENSTLTTIHEHRPCCVTFNHNWRTFGDWPNWVSTTNALPIALWLYDQFPVDRFRAQYPHGELASDLAAPQGLLKDYVTAVKAADATREVAYVAQAYGYNPDQFQALGIAVGDWRNRYSNPTRIEVRYMAWLSLLFGDWAVAFFAHYYNTNGQLAQDFAPVTQEITALNPAASALMSDPFFIGWVDPSTTPHPGITYTKIELLRADGVTWFTLWDGASVTANLGYSGGTYFPGTGGPAGVTHGPGFQVGDLKMRITVSKTSTAVGASVQLSVTGFSVPWEATQSYQHADPSFPGWVAEWDGTTGQHYVEFDLTKLSAGQAGLPFQAPFGALSALPTLVAIPLPSGDVGSAYSMQARTNFPEIGPDSGHNWGVWGRILRTADSSSDPNPAYLLLANSSAFEVTFFGGSYTFDLDPLGFPTGSPPGHVYPTEYQVVGTGSVPSVTIVGGVNKITIVDPSLNTIPPYGVRLFKFTQS